MRCLLDDAEGVPVVDVGEFRGPSRVFFGGFNDFFVGRVAQDRGAEGGWDCGDATPAAGFHFRSEGRRLSFICGSQINFYEGLFC